MRRREFITLLGGTAAWPLAARAQQRSKPVIGYLSGATFEMTRGYVAAFHRGLADTGFIEGSNVTIEYRWAEGHNDRLPSLATDLVDRGVTIIAVGGSTPGALAAKAATQTIPIIFLVGTDPVKVGLVPSLAKPGGNITGITNVNVELIAKCFELIHSLVRADGMIAVLVNQGNIPQAATERRIIQDAAHALGARMMLLEASNPSEIETVFTALVRERASALVVSGEVFFLTQRARLVELTAYHAIPTIYAYREYVTGGGLMSYGGNLRDLYRQIGIYTGRILKGEKTAELPVEQVTKVELLINLKTAKTLGIEIPLSMLMRVDDVIE
ncbi:MAG TPA: ABC transporter substrate-binding protein [Xanthobacteraceae bacterium]|jgi:putative ABC transport system substrate-binding protein